MQFYQLLLSSSLCSFQDHSVHWLVRVFWFLNWNASSVFILLFDVDFFEMVSYFARHLRLRLVCYFSS